MRPPPTHTEGIARTSQGETVVLNQGFAAFMAAIPNPASYLQIGQRTGLARQTLHVYAQRLEECHLVERYQEQVHGKPMTFVRRAAGVLFLNNIRRA